MNRKGFTLIELLAVIILIAIIGIMVAPTLLTTVNSSKEKSYNILIENIETAAKTYYEECEYGDLSNTDKYGSYACIINTNTCKDEEGNSYPCIKTTLGTLANTGFLSVKDVDENNKSKKVVLDPRNKTKDMSNCSITIIKIVSASYKVTYTINYSGSNCPSTKEDGSEE